MNTSDTLKNQSFLDSISGSRYPLYEAIKWIQDNCEPDDVFDREFIKDWQVDMEE